MSTTPQYEFTPARMSSKTWAPSEKFPCMCEQCGQTYEEADWGGPATARAYTCDDCGGYVMDADETREASE